MELSAPYDCLPMIAKNNMKLVKNDLKDPRRSIGIFNVKYESITYISYPFYAFLQHVNLY